MLVRGAMRVLNREPVGLKTPPVVLAATARYRGSEDIVGLFIAEECQTGEHEQVLSPELHKAYVSWCKDNGYPSKPPNAFGEDLASKGFPARRTTGGKRLRCGLRLLAKANG
jgi:putative DNA primase/helicase